MATTQLRTSHTLELAGIEERAVAKEFIHLAYGTLRVTKKHTGDEVERVMRLLDEGRLDGVIEQFAPPAAELPVQRETFADLKSFSHEAWKERHGA